MYFEQLLKQALPTIDPGLIDKAVEELGGSKDSISAHLAEIRAEIGSIKDSIEVSSSETDTDADGEEIAMLRGEIGRLNLLLNRHTEGVAGATKAGLDTLGERARQRRMEGYDDAHDDKHDDYALTSAAIAYLMDARLRGTTGHGFTENPPPDWPWDTNDWKTKGIRQELVVAAALIIAEVERLDRAGINE